MAHTPPRPMTAPPPPAPSITPSPSPSVTRSPSMPEALAQQDSGVPQTLYSAPYVEQKIPACVQKLQTQPGNDQYAVPANKRPKYDSAQEQGSNLSDSSSAYAYSHTVYQSPSLQAALFSPSTLTEQTYYELPAHLRQPPPENSPKLTTASAPNRPPTYRAPQPTDSTPVKTATRPPVYRAPAPIEQQRYGSGQQYTRPPNYQAPAPTTSPVRINVAPVPVHTEESVLYNITSVEHENSTSATMSQDQTQQSSPCSPLPPIQLPDPMQRSNPISVPRTTQSLSPNASSAPISSQTNINQTTSQPSSPSPNWDLFSLPLQGYSSSPLGISPTKTVTTVSVERQIATSPSASEVQISVKPVPSPILPSSPEETSLLMPTIHKSAPICVGAPQFRRTAILSSSPIPSPSSGHPISTSISPVDEHSVVLQPPRKSGKLVWKQHSWLQAADIYKNLVLFLSNDLKYAC